MLKIDWSLKKKKGKGGGGLFYSFLLTKPSQYFIFLLFPAGDPEHKFNLNLSSSLQNGYVFDGRQKKETERDEKTDRRGGLLVERGMEQERREMKGQREKE